VGTDAAEDGEIEHETVSVGDGATEAAGDLSSSFDCVCASGADGVTALWKNERSPVDLVEIFKTYLTC
jgi:hypothetical protein